MGITTCDYCGKEIIRKSSQINRSKNHFCCKKHHDLFQQKINNIVIKDNYAEMIIKKNDKDYIVLIDIEDIPLINTAKWMLKYDKTINDFYVYAWERNNYKNRKMLRLHNYLMNCSKGMKTDHINRNPRDNRKCNLRVVEPMINKQNKGFYKNNKSGYKYIYWNKFCKRWIVQIRRNNILTKIGYFENLSIAIQERNKYCKENKICLL